MMTETWIWFSAAGLAVVAAILVRVILVKRRRAREEQREDIYPMF